ncbi:MAG TPA: chloride channel protein [Acidimicrobiales bacterium]|nr:chloride channel protein [Acidimicrobiales bacterium]
MDGQGRIAALGGIGARPVASGGVPGMTSAAPGGDQGATGAPPDPLALLRSRSYIQLLVLAAVIGVPVSALAYGFLKLVAVLQTWFFGTLPKELGFHGVPAWWPLPLLAVAGLLVSSVIRYLPGRGGHSPADGFHAGGTPDPIDLPGVLLAALATLSLGVVLGPEAPLIAMGGGLGVLAVHLAKRDAPPTAATVMAAAGSFAAISTLFGSPIAGAFLLMEAAGLGGPMLGLVLVPGLLAAGVGTLVFVGLDSLTGFGTFSLAIPGLPPFQHPTGAMFLWALAFGLVASVAGTGIRLLALAVRPLVERRMILLTPLVGLAVAGLAIGFAEATGRSSSTVLFSGQSALPGLVQNAAGWTVGALLLLIVCKSLAYGISLSSFRGGPVFPSLFIGAAGGIAASHLPGLSLVPGLAMGIGAMCTVMLKLPLTSTLLATLLLYSDGLAVMPLVIVAVVVAYAATAWMPQTVAELRGRTAVEADEADTGTGPAQAPAVAAADTGNPTGSAADG